MPQDYFPPALYARQREPTLRVRSVRRDRHKDVTRLNTAADRQRTGSCFHSSKAPSQSLLSSHTPDLQSTSPCHLPTASHTEDPLGSEVWSELLPLRLGLDAGTRHFRLGSWRKDTRNEYTPSPVRGGKSPLSVHLRYPDTGTLMTYSRKKKVYYKTKPTLEARHYAQEVRRKKAFLKLDGKRQELLPCSPSPYRLRRSPSP